MRLENLALYGIMCAGLPGRPAWWLMGHFPVSSYLSIYLCTARKPCLPTSTQRLSNVYLTSFYVGGFTRPSTALGDWRPGNEGTPSPGQPSLGIVRYKFEQSPSPGQPSVGIVRYKFEQSPSCKKTFSPQMNWIAVRKLEWCVPLGVSPCAPLDIHSDMTTWTKPY